MFKGNPFKLLFINREIVFLLLSVLKGLEINLLIIQVNKEKLGKSFSSDAYLFLKCYVWG